MNVKSSDTPSAHFPIQRTSTWMVENFKWFLNGFIILLHFIHVRSRCKTLCKATLLTSDKQSTRIVPQQVKTQGSSHWKAMSQNWMMWKVDLPAITFLKHTFVARCYTLTPFFSPLKENWSDSVDTLRSLSSLILCWNKREKRSKSLLHRNIPLLTNHKQTDRRGEADTYLSKVEVHRYSHWPEVSQNWSQVDPRFACRQNLSNKKMKSYANTPPFLSAFMCL